MSQHEPARPLFGNAIPPSHLEHLIAWSQAGLDGEYSDSETKLFRMAALAYADPRRLSIRKLHQLLLEMIERDDELRGVKSNRPSLATFRHLVLTLPADFIDAQRYGARLTSHDIGMTAEQVMDAICSKRPSARN